ncbi:MAG: IclR family transcriptional regulator [Gaiellaceae bacterium]
MTDTASSGADGAVGLRTIQSVDRAAALLKAVANSPAPLTVVELAAQCGLNRSTAWRLLATLDAHGLVERDPRTQRFSIGYAIFQIAAAGDYDALVRRAHPVLERLAVETGETVNLAVAKRFHLVYVHQVEPPQIMSPNWLGREVALHATSSGKAFLAWLPKEERQALLRGKLERFTSTTVTERRRLEQELEEVRRDGYSVCIGELEEKLYGASAAILNERERPVAIVSVWGPQHRVPAERLPEIGRQARAAADQIESLLS